MVDSRKVAHAKDLAKNQTTYSKNSILQELARSNRIVHKLLHYKLMSIE